MRARREDLLAQGDRGGARIRHHVVGIKMLAEFGVRGKLCVADIETGIGGIQTQSILPGAKLDLRHTLAAQSLVGKQRRRDCRCIYLRPDRSERDAVLDRLVGPLT